MNDGPRTQKCRRGCGADVILACTTVNKKWIPLNATPTTSAVPGSFVLVGTTAYTPAGFNDYLAARAADAINPADYPRHVAHFATCPYTRKGRRKRP